MHDEDRRGKPSGGAWDHEAADGGWDDAPAAYAYTDEDWDEGAVDDGDPAYDEGAYADPAYDDPAYDPAYDEWDDDAVEERHGVRWGALLMLLAVIGVLGGLGFMAVAGMGPFGGVTDIGMSESGETVVVEIPEGAGATTVGEILEEEGVIRSAFAFRLSARFDERSNQLQPGTYELQVGMDADEILEIMSQSPEWAETFRLTIPEGWTVPQILERLASNTDYEVEDFREVLDNRPLPDFVPIEELPAEAEPWEGLLFPETYEFVVDATPERYIDVLSAQTISIVESIEPHGELTRYETLVMASLIEREARLSSEQRTISSVIHNRIGRDMRLEIDATVIYALGEHVNRVLFEDLEVDSPWNTYRNAGLPPTPISNAGASAIRAAADPEQTPYFFYVVVDPETGEHGFSETFEEHQQKIREARG